MALAVLALGWPLGLLFAHEGLDRAAKLSEVASTFIAALLFLSRLIGWVRSRWLRVIPPDTLMPLSQAQDELADVLARQWAAEEGVRRVHDPRPLPVCYVLEPSGTQGDYQTIAELFRSLPSHRLIVLGAAGAGKSTLVVRLARDLVASRRPGEPAPLILNATSWYPEINIEGWIEQELTHSYPALASPVAAADGATTLAALLANGQVLPIVDALDELPEALRVRAIADLSAYGSDHPLVLTSRPDEYQQAIKKFGRPLALVEILTLSPLSVLDCQRYLLEATAGPSRWDDVFAELHRNPTGSLAQALTNPLLLWLTRTVYERSETDPAILLRHGATEDDIQSHLLGHFVPAVYRNKSGYRTTWLPPKAHRWLTFLAQRAQWPVSDEFGQRLAWWQLVRTPGIPTALGTATAITTALLWLTQSYRHDPNHIEKIIQTAADRGPLGRILLPWLRHVLIGTERQFPGTGPTTLDLLPKPGVSAVIWILALTAAVHWWRARGYRTPRRLEFDPRWMLGRLLFVAVATGLLLPAALPNPSFAVSIGPVLWCIAGLSLWTLAHYAPDDLASAAPIGDASSPRRSLHADRVTYTVVAIAQAVARVVLVGLLVGVELAGVFLVVTAVALAMRPLIGSNRRARFASEGYARTSLVWWLSRRVPWRLMAFLADAHQRGVLRQAGAVYRFRHVRLLEYLADEGGIDAWLARHSTLNTYAARIARLWKQAAARIMDWGETGPRHGAEPSLRVTRDSLTWTYRDPRVDRWPRPRQRDRPRNRVIHVLPVVVNTAGQVLGRWPSSPRLVVAAALALTGRRRARQYVTRNVRPLPSVDEIHNRDDQDPRYIELIQSPTLTIPKVIPPDEIVHRRSRRHPFSLIPVIVGTSIAIGACVLLTLRASQPPNLFEFVGLLASLLGIFWAVWRLANYKAARILLTDRRLILIQGLITRATTELPLATFRDISCTRSLIGAIWNFGRIAITTDPEATHIGYESSPLGRLLGYGRLVLHHGQDIAISPVPDPVTTYRLLVDLADPHVLKCLA